MLRTAKPKLSLSISTTPVTSSASASASKPKLFLNTSTITSTSPSLASPTVCRSPRSPLPTSPTVLNTSFNRLSLSFTSSPSCASPSAAAYFHAIAPTYTYNYVNSATIKSILKKDSNSASSAKSGKRLQINSQPTAVHAIMPIDDVDYWYKPVGRW